MEDLQDPRAVAGQLKVAPQLGSPPTNRRTCRFLTNLLSRAASFIIFAVLLAAFPSQAPEFVNQSLLTRSWELLHLLLVGIAVSYGLFSRRNVDVDAAVATDKEAPLHRAEDATPRSYVSQLLQVSSVFDEDDEDDEAARSGIDGSKLQVWNSHYNRVQPAVVIAHGSSVNGGSGAGRPLLLPVRSLRSRIPEESSPRGEASSALPKSGVENGRLGGVASLDAPPPREIPAGGGVLPSPIPWRTRSGRMEVREEPVATAPPSCSLPPPATDADMSALRSPSFRRSLSSRSNSAASSPRKLSPSPSVSPELRAKTGEDMGRKKTIYKPPPPPPPPPPFIHRTPHLPSFKDPKRSFKDEIKEFDSKPRNPVEGCSLQGPVRTVRPTKEAVQVVTAGKSSSPATVAASPPSPAYEYENEEAESVKKNKNRLEEAVVVETDDDDGTDSDEALEDVGNQPGPTRAEADENEVDKKADEFIAKFREQIRLQRIESIRRSAGQRAPSSTK